MKNLIITFIALTLSLNIFAATGNGDNNKDKKNKKEAAAAPAPKAYSADIFEHKDNAVAVHFTKPADQKVTIKIKNVKGEVLFFEKIKNENQVIKKYELDQLPAGEYHVEIHNNIETLVKVITVE